jgi:hypothetical protein
MTMLDSADLKAMKEYVRTIAQSNLQAISNESDGLAAMIATAFGRLEGRLDRIELRMDCIEALIKNPGRVPMQHYVLHREDR